MGLFNSRSVVGCRVEVEVEWFKEGMRTVVELTPKIRFTPVHNTVSENDRKTNIFYKISKNAGSRRKILRRSVNRRDPSHNR
jgi:hypothetical protein